MRHIEVHLQMIRRYNNKRRIEIRTNINAAYDKFNLQNDQMASLSAEMCIIVKFNEMQMRQLNWNILNFSYALIQHTHSLTHSRKRIQFMQMKVLEQQREMEKWKREREK